MNWEIGQQRPDVHLLLAHADVAYTRERFSDIVSFPCPAMLVTLREKQYTSRFSEDDLQAYREHIRTLLSKPEQFRQSLESKFQSDEERARDYIAETGEPITRLRDSLSALRCVSVYLSTLRYVEEQARHRLEHSLADISHERLMLLLSPTSYTPLDRREEQDLLRLAVQYHDGGGYADDLSAHASKYRQKGLHVSTGTEQTFRQRFQTLREQPRAELRQRLESMEGRNEQRREEQRQIHDDHAFTHDQEALIQLLRYIGEIKLRVTDLLSKLNVHIVESMQELSERWNTPEDLLFHLTPNEIENGELPDQEELERRSDAVIFGSEDHVKAYYGERADEFHASKTERDRKTVRGTVAWEGSVTGPIAVVRTADDFSKVEQGDILVTGDTTPDMATLLQRVAGVVTNEGGIISHAATLAREHEIPCVVGTKHATEVFDDGDMVRIETDGTVNQLSG